MSECGCGWEGRCDKHAAMMLAISEVWTHGSEEAADILYAIQDGYGIAGYVPCQGYDWSGIRDSSVEAVEAMYHAIHG